MSRLDLASLREGDVIESHQTLQVTYVATTDDYVEAKDVQSGHLFGFVPSNVDGSQSSRKLTMVKRAVRKPKVGDVITGADVKATMWKRGTVIQSQQNESNIYMLNPYGEWTCSDGRTVGFNVGNSYKFKLLHVA